jgi:hypothetical protein
MVEGKGFVDPGPPTSRNLTTTPPPEAASSGTPRPPASTPEEDTPPVPRSSDEKEGRHEAADPAAEALAAFRRRWASTRYCQDMAELLAKLEGELNREGADGAGRPAGRLG